MVGGWARGGRVGCGVGCAILIGEGLVVSGEVVGAGVASAEVLFCDGFRKKGVLGVGVWGGKGGVPEVGGIYRGWR
jgi:hypothetical protein